MKWAVLWLLLAVLFSVGVGSLNLPLLHRLVENGIRQEAIATKLTPEFHNTVRYEYQVKGTKFEGQTQSWRPNPPLSEIKVGQPLIIYYDPKNPSLSVLGDPTPMLTNEVVSVGMIAVAAPTVIVCLAINNLRKKRLKIERQAKKL